jgi:hypothetical protein
MALVAIPRLDLVDALGPRRESLVEKRIVVSGRPDYAGAHATSQVRAHVVPRFQLIVGELRTEREAVAARGLPRALAVPASR